MAGKAGNRHFSAVFLAQGQLCSAPPRPTGAPGQLYFRNLARGTVRVVGHGPASVLRRSYPWARRTRRDSAEPPGGKLAGKAKNRCFSAVFLAPGQLCSTPPRPAGAPGQLYFRNLARGTVRVVGHGPARVLRRSYPWARRTRRDSAQPPGGKLAGKAKNRCFSAVFLAPGQLCSTPPRPTGAPGQLYFRNLARGTVRVVGHGPASVLRRSYPWARRTRRDSAEPPGGKLAGKAENRHFSTVFLAPGQLCSAPPRPAGAPGQLCSRAAAAVGRRM
ncbi:hypothetical protein CAQUA_10130 [Corynebacterium aquatimens]|uniref:Uncharacterized protein n=1 Tax=Corynebacterium aquatimens TaxID=1190508 RepID=A0A931GTF2_9CORY|nr:hypothetical protein [Corynebacterium aquatimens]WJY66713.1 hypothetical protein CAQUA_10130 [Corynebacterium aquatimens]